MILKKLGASQLLLFYSNISYSDSYFITSQFFIIYIFVQTHRFFFDFYYFLEENYTIVADCTVAINRNLKSLFFIHIQLYTV